MKNPNSLDTLCAALAYAMGIDAPEFAAPANEELTAFVDRAFGGERADRVIMYNPDAIADWVMDKYPTYCKEVTLHAEQSLPLAAVMPSVTPVCFGTMYTGAQPEVHGIQAYEKPVIRIDTLFDAALRAGKKVALITSNKCSLSRIYLEREIDYYHFEPGTYEHVNACAARLIAQDRYDLIVIYNGNFDTIMHKFGPESPEALAELRCNSRTYGMLCEMVKQADTKHNTLIGFAMDHGCHEIDGNCGSHGLDIDEDINIRHYYCAVAKKGQ